MKAIALEKTKAAFLLTNILRAPFWAVYNLLLFILYKDLHASAFQIALFIALKPACSLISIYWSAFTRGRSERLVSNVIWAGVIGFSPFLFFPFVYSPWFVIFASALYMTMHRGVVPAWMEIIKINVPGVSKQKILSYGLVISYIVGAILPFIIGPLLDKYALCWRYLFPITALIAALSIIFQWRIPMAKSEGEVIEKPQALHGHLLDPWKSAWHLLKEHRDFKHYQIGFMLFGGCGLMLLQPALPKFFIDSLGLSYTELSIALTLCKGIGFGLTSSIWANSLHRADFFRISALIAFLGGLFPLTLLAGQFHLFWIYLAYLLYGVMQAGSELVWHLSGPYFAGEKQSLKYSNVNLLTVGLRGSVIPYAGSLICVLASSISVLFFGGLLCVGGSVWLLGFRKKRVPAIKSEI